MIVKKGCRVECKVLTRPTVIKEHNHTKLFPLALNSLACSMETLCDASGLGSGSAELSSSIHEAGEADITPRELFENGNCINVLAKTTELIPKCIGDASPAYVLELWYYRVQSLLILHRGHQAAQEISSHLGSLDSHEFVATLKTPEDIYNAWFLSLLLVPVKTKGINPGSVQHYYTLGFKARQEALKSKGMPIEQKWWDGVKLAGLHVLSTLIALRDYMTAIHLLKTHYEVTRDSLYAKILALLHILIGDTIGCQAWASKTEDKSDRDEIDALRKFADGELKTGNRGSCIDSVNELYQGKLLEALEHLEMREGQLKGDAKYDTRRISNLAILHGTCFETSNFAAKP